MRKVRKNNNQGYLRNDVLPSLKSDPKRMQPVAAGADVFQHNLNVRFENAARWMKIPIVHPYHCPLTEINNMRCEPYLYLHIRDSRCCCHRNGVCCTMHSRFYRNRQGGASCCRKVHRVKHVSRHVSMQTRHFHPPKKGIPRTQRLDSKFVR